MRDPYCYPDTDILRNRLSIMDDKKLRVAEADYVSLNLAELAREDAERTFDFKELCRMHYRIFRDIFDWAGKPRVINIEKMEAPLGNISIEYSDVFDIERDAQSVLKDMNLYGWKKAPFDETVRKFSDFMLYGKALESAPFPGREHKDNRYLLRHVHRGTGHLY